MNSALQQIFIEALRSTKSEDVPSINKQEEAKDIAQEAIGRAMETAPTNEEWLTTSPPKKPNKQEKKS